MWTFKTSTILKSMELKFKLGEEFEESTPDGREVKAIVTHEGDKSISVQTATKKLKTVAAFIFFFLVC